MQSGGAIMLNPDDFNGALLVIGICCVIYLIYYFATDGGNDAD